MKISKMLLYWLILPLLFKEYATFEFLIESGTVSFISNMKMKELTLDISVDLTKESIDTFTKALKLSVQQCYSIRPFWQIPLYI